MVKRPEEMDSSGSEGREMSELIKSSVMGKKSVRTQGIPSRASGQGNLSRASGSGRE